MSHWRKANGESKFSELIFVQMVGGPAGEGRARMSLQFRCGRYNELSLWLVEFEILMEYPDRDSSVELRAQRTETN